MIDKLAAGEGLPPENRDHALTGNYQGFRECHITPDWLLLYEVSSSELIMVMSRTGTHTDILDKKAPPRRLRF